MTASINASTVSGVVVTSDTSGSFALQTAGITAVTIDSSQNITMPGNITTTGNITMNGTSALSIPQGTTAQRPNTPVNGMIRYNTTLDYIEWYNSSGWLPTSQSSVLLVDYIIVGGGGAGSNGTAGGGGGGGFVSKISIAVPTGTTYQVIVGAGRAASGTTQSAGASGVSSSFNSFTALGGGYGANTSGNGGNAAGNGGNGGGAASYTTTYSAGLGTSGQGYAGSNSPDTSGGGLVEGTQDHRGQGNAGRDSFPALLRVPFDLEGPAKRRQLWPETPRHGRRHKVVQFAMRNSGAPRPMLAVSPPLRPLEAAKP